MQRYFKARLELRMVLQDQGETKEHMEQRVRSMFTSLVRLDNHTPFRNIVVEEYNQLEK